MNPWPRRSVQDPLIAKKKKRKSSPRSCLCCQAVSSPIQLLGKRGDGHDIRGLRKKRPKGMLLAAA